MTTSITRLYKGTALIPVLFALLLAPTAAAQQQELFIYPNKGQSQQQQEKDKFECYTWAKNNTGFDPMASPTATSAPPAREAKQGGVAKGAVAGAAVGTTIGVITGKRTGKKALAGAAAGGLIGGMRRNDQQRRESHNRQQWERDQTAQYAHSRNQYNRAHAACLEGRGYTVR
jgi:hypothetical protein